MPFMSAEWCVGRVQREFELCTSWWGVRSVDWFTSVGWWPRAIFRYMWARWRLAAMGEVGSGQSHALLCVSALALVSRP